MTLLQFVLIPTGGYFETLGDRVKRSELFVSFVLSIYLSVSAMKMKVERQQLSYNAHPMRNSGDEMSSRWEYVD